MRKEMAVMAAAVCAAVMLAGTASAQRQPGGGNTGGNQPGRGTFDPAQMRQRMLDRVKEQLGATDQEWQVLQPRVEKVMTLQNAARSRGFGGFGGRGGRGGDTGTQPTLPADASAVQKAYYELQTLLNDPNAKAPDISSKLAALRDARTKAQDELKAAQKALKELLTPKQEAQLVLNGMLE